MRIFRVTTCFLFLCKIGTAQVIITNLLTEGQKNPLSIDTPSPRFSWQVALDAGKVYIQAAYELEVDTLDAKTGRQGSLWSSGKVLSSLSLYVPYRGKVLRAGHSYSWKVKTWDTGGKQSSWSEPAVWTMGLLSPADWQAKWIAPSVPDAVNGPAPLLRTNFSLNKEIREATAYITSHGFYEAQINGRKVGDAYLTPGWTSYNKRLQYQAYDVKELLKSGDNAIGVTLGSGWYRSPLGPYNPRPDFYGKNLGLLLQIKIVYADGSQKLIISDENWKSSTGALRFAEIYDGAVIDSRLAQQGWSDAGFDDRKLAGCKSRNL
jgi:alpha-L-rhamnosidase